MKKVLVAAILGLAATASVKAQGQIILYNYAQPSTKIVYGQNSGGTLGNGITGSWTIGLYDVAGNSVTAVNTFFTGDSGRGTLVGSGLTLETETATLISGYPGQYGPTTVTTPFSGTGTFVIVAYNGATYETSSIRGHSTAFTANSAVSPALPIDIGSVASSFAVVGPIPEPSTFALAGLGLAGLLIFRRRN